MKQIIKFAVSTLMTGVILFASCKKDDLQLRLNKTPIAYAGQDQNITLPTDSVILEGNGSTDEENSIVSYEWTKVAGSASVKIVNSKASKTVVKNFAEGIYLFELKVTDAEGLFSNDTMEVKVNPPYSLTNMHLVSFGTLSEWRTYMTTASAGNKIFFAGGITERGGGEGIAAIHSRVDIYDTTTQTWTIAELSQPRYGVAAASIGNKVFFAGGIIDESGTATTRVDIYDASSNSWSTAEMSEANSHLAAASAMNKVIFGGSFFSSGFSNRVSIYDASANSWATETISQPRGGIGATASASKIYFGGGCISNGIPSDRVDIYDAATGTWSTAALSEARWDTKTATVGNKVIFAGGATIIDLDWQLSTRIDIYDNATDTWSVDSLAWSHSHIGEITLIGAVNAGNLGLFFPGSNRIYVYNSADNSWSTSNELEFGFAQGTAFVAAGNHVLIAGGNEVWRLAL